MSIITLTTDYGLKDPFVGAMKGKLMTKSPDSTIIDISHYIDPFNIAEAAYVIGTAFHSFPEGTVHLIGVDVESNKETQLIAMLWKGHYFVCADNGILSILIQNSEAEELYTLYKDEKWTDLEQLLEASVHLSKKGTFEAIGEKRSTLKNNTEIQARVEKNQIIGTIVYIDHFGNAVTNISKQFLEEKAKNRSFTVHHKGTTFKNVYSKYSDIGNSSKFPLKDFEGQKLALFNEAGFLEIAIFRSNPSSVGSATSLLGISYRDVVTVEFIENKE